MEGNILKVIISVTPLCWHAKKHMAPFPPLLVANIYPSYHADSALQRDKLWMDNRNKEREHIFSTPVWDNSKFPDWGTISSYWTAWALKRRLKRPNKIWYLKIVQCTVSIWNAPSFQSVKYNSGRECNANVANVSIGIRNALAAYGLWN